MESLGTRPRDPRLRAELVALSPGPKDDAIREHLRISGTRYYELLSDAAR